MTEFDDKIEEETTMNVTDRLPELDEEETSTALENVRWAAGFVGPLRDQYTTILGSTCKWWQLEP